MILKPKFYLWTGYEKSNIPKRIVADPFCQHRIYYWDKRLNLFVYSPSLTKDYFYNPESTFKQITVKQMLFEMARNPELGILDKEVDIVEAFRDCVSLKKLI